MSINFTSNINDFASAQSRATRVKNFTEFTSKKKLEDAGPAGGSQENQGNFHLRSAQ